MASTKLLTSKAIGISSETDRLTRAAVAGLPSIEQELIQLYPTNKSLFLDHMDVLKARQELTAFTGTLASNGVDVIVMKEELAKILPYHSLSKYELLGGLFRRAEYLHAMKGSGVPLNAITQIKVNIEYLLHLDSQIYGEKGAIALAKALCLDPGHPLGNIIYARDQMNVVFGTRIVANMAYEVRQPEVKLYEMVYEAVLGPHVKITIPKGEVFEGGSLYMHNNTVYIDVQPRTTMGAALHIISELHKKYPDATYAIVMNGNKGETFIDQQKTMHLDTYSMPIGDKTFAVCEEQAEKRHVYIVEGGKLISTGKSFIEYLQAQGYDIASVSNEEQSTFGCNVLMLDSKTAIMPTASRNAGITKLMRKNGITVKEAAMDEVTNGFGASHCAVGQLLRE